MSIFGDSSFIEVKIGFLSICLFKNNINGSNINNNFSQK